MISKKFILGAQLFHLVESFYIFYKHRQFSLTLNLNLKHWFSVACIGLSFLLAISCQSDPPSEGRDTFDTQLSAMLAEDSLGWAYWEAAEAALNEAQSRDADSLYQLAANTYGQAGNYTGQFWALAKRAEMLAGRASQDSTFSDLVYQMEACTPQLSSDTVAFWADILLRYVKGLPANGIRPYSEDSYAYFSQLATASTPHMGLPYNELLSQLYFLLGDIHFQFLGNPDSAAVYLEKSLILEMDQAPSLALSDKTLIYGWVKEQQGEYEYAARIQQFTLGLRQHFLGPNHIKVANAWNHLGNCQYEKQAYESAREAYSHAYQNVAESNIYPFHEIAFLNNQVTTLEQLEQTDSLENAYIKVQFLIDTYFREEPETYEYYQVLNHQNRAAFYIDQGLFEKAEPLLLEASKIAKQLGNPTDMVPAHTQILLTELYHKQGKYRAAQHAIRQAKKLAGIILKEDQVQIPESTEPGLVLDLFSLSAKVHYDSPSVRLMDHKRALAELKLLFQFAQQERRILSLEEDQLHTGTSIQQQLRIAVQLAYTLLQETTDSTYLHQAFSLMELSKSQVLQQELTRQATATRAQRHRGHILSLKQGGISDLSPNSANQIERLATEQTFLQQLILRVHEPVLPDTLLSKKNTPQLSPLTSLSEIQSLLKPKELLLTYMVSDTVLWELSASASRTQMRAIRRDSSFTERQDIFLRAVSDPNSNLMETRVRIMMESGYQLSEQLLFPACQYHFEKDRIPTRIHVVPDAGLSRFPFELLPTNRQDAHYYHEIPYLIRVASVNYGFSAALLTPDLAPIEQDKVQKSLLSLVGLDDTNVDIDIEVPASFQQLKLTGRDATKTQFSQEAPHHPLLQILAHGFADDKAENPYMLIKGAGVKHTDTLFAHEVSMLPLEAELVLLTACDGTQGQLISGEGSFSLLRAFKMAQARNLVGGLWKVHITPLSNILTQFYAGYANGASTDEALRAAKLAYLKDVSLRESDPAMWGSLVPFNQIIVNH